MVSTGVLILDFHATVGVQAQDLQNTVVLRPEFWVSGARLGFRLNSRLSPQPLPTSPSHTHAWASSYLPSAKHAPDSYCFQDLKLCIKEIELTLCMWPWVTKRDQELLDVPRAKPPSDLQSDQELLDTLRTKPPSDLPQAVGEDGVRGVSFSKGSHRPGHIPPHTGGG